MVVFIWIAPNYRESVMDSAAEINQKMVAGKSYYRYQDVSWITETCEENNIWLDSFFPMLK